MECTIDLVFCADAWQTVPPRAIPVVCNYCHTRYELRTMLLPVSMIREPEIVGELWD